MEKLVETYSTLKDSIKDKKEGVIKMHEKIKNTTERVVIYNPIYNKAKEERRRCLRFGIDFL